MPFIDSKISMELSSDQKEKIKTKLGIPANNIYVTYHGVHDWGWNGSNF